MYVDADRPAFQPFAGERSLLQAGANTVNNDPRLLAPAPSAGMARPQPVVNVTTRSFFVLTAASGSLTRTVQTGSNSTNEAVLTLDGIDQQVTWYSGVHTPSPSAQPSATGGPQAFWKASLCGLHIASPVHMTDHWDQMRSRSLLLPLLTR